MYVDDSDDEDNTDRRQAAAGGLAAGHDVRPVAGQGGRPDGVGGGRQARDWCVTSKTRPTCFTDPLGSNLVFACGQQERGEGGFEHWQVFLQFDVRVRLHQVKAAVGDNSAHCESRRGTPTQARDYCRKSDTGVEGSYWEGGKFRGGKTNHMDDIKEALDDGADVWTLMREHFSTWTRCEKACDRYIQARDALRASTWCPAKVEVHWGASGTGKTRYCMEAINLHYGGVAYRKPSGPWWDGYSRQQVVLFDDYDGTIPIDTLLQVLDGYGRGVLLPIKGSHINCWARTFFFTSNRDPDSWYPHAAEEQRAGLRRRISVVREYRQGDPVVKLEPPVVVDMTDD